MGWTRRLLRGAAGAHLRRIGQGWPWGRPFGMVRPRVGIGPVTQLSEGRKRVDVARFRRGTSQAVRFSGARPRPQAREPAGWCDADPGAVLAWQGGPARDRATGPAHLRCHAGERDLFGPLRVFRQGSDLRRALAVPGDAAVRGMGGWAPRLRLAAPPARRRI